VSVLIDLADGVTAALNAGSFSLSFTAARVHQPSHDLVELADLRVNVVPRSLLITGATRQLSSFEAAIDVGIQKHVAGDAEVDQLLDLAQEVADHLRHTRLDDVPEAAWVSIAHDPVVAAELLDQHRVLTSVLTVTYRVLR